jgi:hypothetical protein
VRKIRLTHHVELFIIKGILSAIKIIFGIPYCAADYGINPIIPRTVISFSGAVTTLGV